MFTLCSDCSGLPVGCAAAARPCPALDRGADLPEPCNCRGPVRCGPNHGACNPAVRAHASQQGATSTQAAGDPPCHLPSYRAGPHTGQKQCLRSSWYQRRVRSRSPCSHHALQRMAAQRACLTSSNHASILGSGRPEISQWRQPAHCVLSRRGLAQAGTAGWTAAPWCNLPDRFDILHLCFNPHICNGPDHMCSSIHAP
jgi:hypothetical protein